MKRMFSEEEIQKIAEAAGGGVTPDDVKAILDDSLEYDDTTKGLVNNAIAEYLENNPPAKYVHNIFIEQKDVYHIMFSIVTSDPDKFTATSLANFLYSLEASAKIPANGYIQSGDNNLDIFAISRAATAYFSAISQSGSHTFFYSSMSNITDNVYSA